MCHALEHWLATWGALIRKFITGYETWKKQAAWPLFRKQTERQPVAGEI
jgi:hypothetical protein